MEDILDLYAEPHDSNRPQVCLDEVSYQRLTDVREPLAGRRGRPRRQDYEYGREGTANLFVALEPLAGQRVVQVTERRTAVDFAHFIKHLVDEVYPQAEVIRLVLDNLNTHSPASLYEAFPAAEARRLTRKLELHPTPKHASWLNAAEIEIGVLKRQCLKRRIGHPDTLRAEVAACVASRNAQRAKVVWSFTTSKAREKLARFYDL